MPLYLEADSMISIQIDYREEFLPTCHICGRQMNYMNILSDCVFIIRKLQTQTGKDIRDLRQQHHISLEGGTTHIHFVHNHPNDITKKRAIFCPMTGNRW